MDNYERIEQIATGKSGSFWKAKRKDTDQIVVIKEEKLQKKKIFKILKHLELRLLGICRNANLVQFIQLIKEYETLYIILQYCEKNLQNEIDSRQSNPFEESEIRYILSEVCKGLKDIHDNKYIHRDICPKNIYITPNHVVLGDFSNILCLRDKKDCIYHGNVNYSSPEVSKDPLSADYKSDIYSLGCMLLELVNPKEFKSNIDKIKDSKENEINWDDIDLPSDLSSDLLSLIKAMLENNMEQRISLDDVMSHSFINNGELKNFYNSNNDNNINKIKDNNSNGNVNDLSPNSQSSNNNNNMRNLDDSLESSIDDEIPSENDDDENASNPLLHLSFDKMNTKSLYEEIAYRNSEEEEFSEDEIRWFLKEMIKELTKFHGENYVIRDISPKQLYFISNELKIGVFHNAVDTQKESFPLKTPTSTYTAPEIINNLSYSNCSSDLFSIGCIMLELYNPGSYKMNIKVIETANDDETISWNLVKLPSNISDEAVEVLKGLLNMEIEHRMTLDDLSKHPFMSKDTNPISPESRSLRRVSSHIGSLLSLTHVATVESIEPTADHEVKATPRRFKPEDKDESKETPKLTVEEKDGVENESNSEFDFDDESFATNQESKENHSQIVPSLNIGPEESKEKEENKMKPDDDGIENSSEDEDEDEDEEEDDDDDEDDDDEDDEEEDDEEEDDEDEEEEEEEEEEESSSSEEKKKKKVKKTKKSRKTKKAKKSKKSKTKKEDVKKEDKNDNDDDDNDDDDNDDDKGNAEGGMKPPEDSDSDELENSEEDNNEEDNGDEEEDENKNSDNNNDNSNSDSKKKKDEEKTKKKNDIDEQIDEDDEEYDNFEEDDEERDEVADTVAEPTLPPELAGATTDLTTIDENAEEPQMLLPLNPSLTAQPKRKLRKATPSPQQLIAEANSTVIEGPSTFLKDLPLNEMDEEDESMIKEESEENYEGESL